MPSTQHLQFAITINAPASVVWHHVTDAASYSKWTSPFSEGSHFQGTWAPGTKMIFMGPDGNGMVSEIAESRPHEFISIRHLGFVARGVEDTTSDAVRAWAPAYEDYTFSQSGEQTRMIVDQDVAPDWAEHLSGAWPKALEILKRLSES